MNQHEWLAERFEVHRAHLRAVAYRMLGSASEADDAVQEAWLRLSRADASEIENLGGWLTTVVARVCLDMLRVRKSRREEPLALDPAAGLGLETQVPDPVAVPLGAAAPGNGANPEDEALLAEGVGLALLVVLDTLTPADRLACVLYDMFAVPFDEIAPIVGRSPDAAKMLASRARRRVQGQSQDAGAAAAPGADPVRQRAVVEAFLAASRDGDFEALLALLDPDVVLRADEAAVRVGAVGEVRGAAAVAGTFSGRARAARLASIDGAAGAVWAPGGQPRIVFGFTVTDGKVVGISLLADPERLRQLDLVLLDS